MTQKEINILLHFITKPFMFISILDRDNIISFMHGFECLTKNKFPFTNTIRKLASEKYKIKYDSLGWPGQIDKLAKKKSLPWAVLFRSFVLEALVSPKTGLYKKKSKKILKSRIESVLSQIDRPYYTIEGTTKEWLSLSTVKADWYRALWSEQEIKILKAIDKELKSGDIYSNSMLIPSKKMLDLKFKFDNLQKKK
jgi:hypothetical protein